MRWIEITALLINLAVLSMGAAQLSDFSVKSVHDFLLDGSGSCSKVVDYFLERAYKYNPKLNAIITFNSRLKADALKIDEDYRKSGFKGRLHCVPIIVKDNIDVKELPMTGGIKALRYSIPNRDALVVKRLKDEGALVLAKSNLAELAAGERYNSEMGGTCNNPYDLTKSCGTSSTGTGASMSGGLAVIGIGTDTTGSILFPATFNGVWGLRTPIDLTWLDGVFSFNNIHSIDAVGPMARNLDDLILAYDIMKGGDKIVRNFQFDEQSKTNADSLKFSIGMVKEFNNYLKLSVSIGDFEYIVEDEVKSLLNNTINRMKSIASFSEVSLSQDDMDDIHLIFEALIDDRCQSNCVRASLDTYFGDKSRFESDAPYKTFDEFSQSPLLSRFWATYFRPPIGAGDLLTPKQKCDNNCEQFLRIRERAEKMVDRWFAKNNNATIILTPTISKLDYSHERVDEEQFVTLIPVFTVAGLPALSVPIGYADKSGVPAGMLLWTRNVEDAFAIGKYLENRRGVPLRLPQSTPLLESIKSASSPSYSSPSFLSIFVLIFLCLTRL